MKVYIFPIVKKSIPKILYLGSYTLKICQYYYLPVNELFKVGANLSYTKILSWETIVLNVEQCKYF